MKILWDDLLMSGEEATIQITSKQRVSDHGEVFTSEREVNAMLDLVHQETQRIDSRFLEPACGTGNFLAPVLERKMELLRKKYGRSQLEFERYAVAAVGSVYGVDILGDNAELCKKRLFDIFDSFYTSLYKKKSKDSFRTVIRFILNRNILWGDALSLKTVTKQPEPIIFSEWSLVRGSMVKRRDFTFEELLPNNAKNQGLFAKHHMSDLGVPAFIPNPVREFPLVHILSLHENTN